jgi:hypothetical protein
MTARPRGFIVDWHPHPERIVVLNQAKAVLVERAEQPALERSADLYRLVGVYAYEKSEEAYKRWTTGGARRDECDQV